MAKKVLRQTMEAAKLVNQQKQVSALSLPPPLPFGVGGRREGGREGMGLFGNQHHTREEERDEKMMVWNSPIYCQNKLKTYL